jgi:hypothetical protein
LLKALILPDWVDRIGPISDTDVGFVRVEYSLVPMDMEEVVVAPDDQSGYVHFFVS